LLSVTSGQFNPNSEIWSRPQIRFLGSNETMRIGLRRIG
jgi:hypothetical protein